MELIKLYNNLTKLKSFYISLIWFFYISSRNKSYFKINIYNNKKVIANYLQ